MVDLCQHLLLNFVLLILSSTRGMDTFVCTEGRGSGQGASVCDASACKEVARWGSTPTLVQTNFVFMYHSGAGGGWIETTQLFLLSRLKSEISPLRWISACSTRQYHRLWSEISLDGGSLPISI